MLVTRNPLNLFLKKFVKKILKARENLPEILKNPGLELNEPFSLTATHRYSP